MINDRLATSYSGGEISVDYALEKINRGSVIKKWEKEIGEFISNGFGSPINQKSKLKNKLKQEIKKAVEKTNDFCSSCQFCGECKDSMTETLKSRGIE